jgi:excisionase family DNA binding protein
MTQLPPFLTPRQASEYLTESGVAVSQDAVTRWCREGKIAAITLPGGQYRIRREELEAILSGQPATAVAR